jgi:hypothetical protein
MGGSAGLGSNGSGTCSWLCCKGLAACALCVLRRPSPAEVLLAESNIKALGDVLQVRCCCWCWCGCFVVCLVQEWVGVQTLPATAAVRAAGCVVMGFAVCALCVLRHPSAAEVLLAESSIKALGDVLQVRCCWCWCGCFVVCLVQRWMSAGLGGNGSSTRSWLCCKGVAAWALCVLRRPSAAEVLLAESNIKALGDVLQVSLRLSWMSTSLLGFSSCAAFVVAGRWCMLRCRMWVLQYVSVCLQFACPPILHLLRCRAC